MTLGLFTVAFAVLIFTLWAELYSPKIFNNEGVLIGFTVVICLLIFLTVLSIWLPS